MNELRRLLVSGLFLVPAFIAQGQAPAPKLPCDFSGDLLRNKQGGIVQYPPAEMKQRATVKADVNGFVKQMDIRTVVVVSVLVNPSGQVVCAKSKSGSAMVQKPVETALRSWRFKPATFKGRPVAYLGLMQFTLCNILCGEDAPSMTLLN